MKHTNLIIIIIVIMMIICMNICCMNTKELFKDKLLYGGQDFTYMVNPSDPLFKIINSSGNDINVPYHDIYTNKSLYHIN